MDTKTKVAVNAIILYAKIIITMILSLVTVPIVLRALGESDYGIYNLVAGVISMLAFLNASMSISTQRFLSVSNGEGNSANQNRIFNVSIIMHGLVGVAVIILLEIFFPFIFSGFLKIEPGRLGAAKLVYQLLIFSTFFSILAVPMEAVLNAEENMLSFSVIDICVSLLKILLAFFLISSPGDRLVVYGAGMLIITFISFATYSLYVLIHYKNKLKVNFSLFDSSLMREMFGFMGWNALGSIAMLGRNQGVAILFNVFFGTIANAAYGIANQVHGALQTFSSTFQKAINPQLMISEGMNSRDRLIRIAFISSRVSVFVMSVFAVPLILEMPYVLKLWLHEVPDYTAGLCQLMLLFSILYQFSSGLMSSVQAVGIIRGYMVGMTLLALAVIPISYFLLQIGLPVYTVMVVWVSIEGFSLFIRLYQASRVVGISILGFIRRVLLPLLVSIIAATFFAWLIHIYLVEGFFRVIVVSLVFFITFCLFSWFIVFGEDEHLMACRVLNKVKMQLTIRTQNK